MRARSARFKKCASTPLPNRGSILEARLEPSGEGFALRLAAPDSPRVSGELERFDIPCIDLDRLPVAERHERLRAVLNDLPEGQLPRFVAVGSRLSTSET